MVLLGGAYTTSREIPKVVLIIGESTQRNYMSLYGYPLPTTPRLDTLARDKRLFVFNDVIAPYAYTDSVLARLLTFSHYENAQTPWFYQQNLIDIMKQAGYKTHWISNQEAISIYGNAPQVIAQRADVLRYTSITDSYMGFTLDEQILPLLSALKATDPSFYVLHLMGTHSAYHNRYPKSFEIFSHQTLADTHQDTRLDSTTLTPKQSAIRAQYLNAIAYNDLIVSTIIEHFADDEALIFYLSDHGDEVYEIGDFAGHSLTKTSRYMLEIPFMVYVSPKLAHKYPRLLQSLERARDLPFMSDDFIHALLDIIGIAHQDFRPQRSLFHKDYNTHRARIANGSYDYDRELRDPYPFSTPEKIWLHRSDDTQKLKDFASVFANFEIDVHFLYDESGWYFDVGHDGAKDSIHLKLESMLEILHERDSHLNRHKGKIWLDFKNLDSTNATNALQTLQNLATIYDYPPAHFIIESPNYEQLCMFKQAGFFTSYYVPYYSRLDLDSRAPQIREHIQSIIQSDCIQAISFPYYLYEFIKAQHFSKDNQDLPLLTWNEGSDVRGNMLIPAFSDPQVKVILAGVKGKYR
ncbi:sulfatase-like hydrolase/transferase [uncultured Helicobacter sp.]|uniref:sulfatase-like hydrolase/transferase n=1 Tax=uncultured Helicobacter sp. TaxID=175537 RepID=UPI00374FAE1D